jgi:UDP-galactopyranose mutase
VSTYDTLIVGAGYAGSIVAERLATELGHRVLVIDRRDHIAGNAFDYYDEHGVQVHRYGPHIFHTNSEKVVDYLSRFTEWRPYEHRVVASVDGLLLPMPINRDTINRLYGLELATEEEVEAFYADRREDRPRMETSEDAVVAKVGWELYEKFFRGYTRKQWELDPKDLHASVCARIPIRTNTDDRYFTDGFQKMPADGYTAMFERILDHPNIDVRLETPYEEVKDEVGHAHLVWTGPIDEFFGHRFGPLPYRSLHFDLETHDTPDGGYLFPAGSINEPSEEIPYTRRTEFRRLGAQDGMTKTTIAVEYPRSEGDPYYPIPREQNRALFKRYRELADELADEVTFVGRLANYQYLNMDQVTAQALTTFERMVADRRVGAPAR